MQSSELLLVCERKTVKMSFAPPGDKQNLPPNVVWTSSAWRQQL